MMTALSRDWATISFVSTQFVVACPAPSFLHFALSHVPVHHRQPHHDSRKVGKIDGYLALGCALPEEGSEGENLFISARSQGSRSVWLVQFTLSLANWNFLSSPLSNVGNNSTKLNVDRFLASAGFLIRPQGIVMNLIISSFCAAKVENSVGMKVWTTNLICKGAAGDLIECGRSASRLGMKD